MCEKTNRHDVIIFITVKKMLTKKYRNMKKGFILSTSETKDNYKIKYHNNTGTSFIRNEPLQINKQ